MCWLCHVLDKKGYTLFICVTRVFAQPQASVNVSTFEFVILTLKLQAEQSNLPHCILNFLPSISCYLKGPKKYFQKEVAVIESSHSFLTGHGYQILPDMSK